MSATIIDMKSKGLFSKFQIRFELKNKISKTNKIYPILSESNFKKIPSPLKAEY